MVVCVGTLSDKEPSILYWSMSSSRTGSRLRLSLFFWTQKWGRFKAGHFLDQFIRLTRLQTPYGNRMQSFFKVGGSASAVLDSFVSHSYDDGQFPVNDLLSLFSGHPKSNNTLDQQHRVYISENRSSSYSRPRLAHLSLPENEAVRHSISNISFKAAHLEPLKSFTSTLL